MRVGRKKGEQSNTSIDLTPLLDTAFILIFFFLFYVIYLSATIVNNANENAAVAEEQLGKAELEVADMEAAMGGKENEIQELNIALSELQMENMALTDELQQLMDDSESFSEKEHLRGYEEIQQVATLICVRFERYAGTRNITVLENDEPISEVIEYDDAVLQNVSDRVYNVVEKRLGGIPHGQEGQPIFVYLSRNEQIVLNNDVKAIYERLTDLESLYDNIYIVK